MKLFAALLWAACCVGQQDPRTQAPGERRALERAGRPDAVNDPEVVGYLSRLTGKLAAQCPAAPLNGVRLIDSDEINAFAIPGGFLFVHTGLIRKAESEAEVAAVLANVIAQTAAPPIGIQKQHGLGPVDFCV